MYLLSTAKSPDYGTALVQRVKGLGACRGLGCASCDGCKAGLGLFDAGADFKAWGPLEWGVVGVGAFALFSMFSTTKRGVRTVSKGMRSRAAKNRRRQELQRELSSL